MNRLIAKISAAAALSLAAMPFIVLADAAHADVRIQVGDLSRADQAAAFTQRISAAADTFCAVDVRDLAGASRVAACRQAVQDEAVASLSAEQRAQLASNAGVTMTLAAR
jgi:UrcA family protein